MSSPFPKSSPKPGNGTVHLTLLPPSNPSFTTLNFTYPLKLILSNPHTLPLSKPPTNTPIPDASSPPNANPSRPLLPSTVPLLFLLTYGGGLLPIDHIHLTLTLDAYARLTIATQGSTKIYKADSSSPSPTSTQTLTCTLGPHSSLFYSPHPTQPFASSRYAQLQTFTLYPGASLGVLDWVSEGRRARGESWAFEAWRGRNEVWSISPGEEKRRLLLRDSVVLEGAGIKGRMDGRGIFGTVILVGPVLEPLAGFWVEEFGALPRIGGRNWDGDAVKVLTPREKWRGERQVREVRDGVVWTAARVRDGRAVVVKFAARDVQGAREWLGDMLREEGSVAREFGEGALMGVG